MNKKASTFSPEVRKRAVRLVREQRSEHPSMWAAVESIAPTIGCTPQTLLDWVGLQPPICRLSFKGNLLRLRTSFLRDNSEQSACRTGWSRGPTLGGAFRAVWFPCSAACALHRRAIQARSGETPGVEMITSGSEKASSNSPQHIQKRRKIFHDAGRGREPTGPEARLDP